MPLSERRQTTTSLQALFLMNSKFIHEQSNTIAERLLAASQGTPARVKWAFELLLNQEAKPPDIAKAEEFLAMLGRQYRTAGCDGGCEQRAWGSYVRSMLASNAFLYVE